MMTLLPCSVPPAGLATDPNLPPPPPLVWLATPRFIVGVTGSMTLSTPENDFIKRIVRQVLDWIAPSAVAPSATDDDELASSVKSTLGEPLGLDRSSLMLLSSLAPGADQIVADIFGGGSSGNTAPVIRCPLPFPVAHYKGATTFDNAQDADKPDAVIARLSLEQHCFTVLRPDDIGKSKEELNEVYDRERTGDKCRVARNYRYRAAGEYIATNCDLLIAICRKQRVLHTLCGCEPTDEKTRQLPPDARPGAEEIVRVRLQGATPGVLANHPALTWSDAGPVLLIDVDSAPAAKATTHRDPVITWLSPYDTLPDRIPSSNSGGGGALTPNLRATSDRQWLRGELLSLRAYARQFVGLNAKSRMCAAAEPNASNKLLLPYPPARFQPQDNRPWLPSWKNIMAWSMNVQDWLLREWAAIQKCLCKSPKCKPTGETYACKLDALATLRRRIANVGQEYDARVKSMTARLKWLSLSVACFLGIVTSWRHSSDAAVGWSPPRVAFAMAFILALAAYLLHLRFKLRRVVEWQNDARALTEALRVQFYWTAAGVNQSVAAHYLQQEQNELVWIRGAANSVAIPAEEGCASISCSHEGLDSLKCIKNGWLSGQLEYLKGRVYEFEEAKHSENFVRTTAFLAGVTLTLYEMVSSLWMSASADHAQSTLTATAPLLAWLAALFVLHVFWRYVVHWAWHRPNVPDGTEVGDSAVSSLYKLYRTKWFRKCAAGVAGLSLGAALIGLMQSQWASEESALGPLKLREFIIGQLLAVAGLWHWHASTKFYDQNVKRYAALANLFRGAESRFANLLARMTQCVETADPGKPLDSAASDKFERLLYEMRYLLVTLGVEALNENSAWLTMHRDHPIEPPKPIG